MMSGGSKMPQNFSWVVDDKICAMAFPGETDNIRYLLERNVTYLISLTAERDPPVQDFKELNFTSVKVQDFTPPTLEQIDTCLGIMEKANGEGKAAGLHCAHGQGRTGTVLACYLVKNYKLRGQDAINRIRIYRPKSIETPEQEKRVLEYEEYIRHNNPPEQYQDSLEAIKKRLL